MFGLTRREQRWKAEQQAGEVLASLLETTVKAVAAIRVAEVQTDTNELERLRKKYDELIFAVGIKYHAESRHETALRYIKRMEEPTTMTPAKVSDNTQ